MGKAMFDYLENPDPSIAVKVDTNLTEDEDLPMTYMFRSFEESPELEQEALKLCKGKVLDVGAGAGPHALWLQEQEGIEVSAMEVSANSIEVMKRRGVKNPLFADFFTYNEEKFDTVLLLMNGLGIAGKMEGVPKFLQRIHDLLNSGGQCLIESADILHLFRADDGSVMLDLNGPYYGEITYQISYKGIVGEEFDWLYMAYDLLEEFATGVGLKCEKLMDGPEDSYLARMVKP